MTKSEISLFGESSEKGKDIIGGAGQTIVKVGKVVGAGVLLGLGFGVAQDIMD